MRLRFNKEAKSLIHQDQKYFVNTESLVGIDPHTWFANTNNPIYLEIGMGKGNFVINNAFQNPNINYIGLEKFDTVLWKAIRKAQLTDLENLKMISFDAINLNQLFIPHVIDKIYLNFSDPWPKDRHQKRRLTHPVFLDLYKSILKKDGVIEFKTDNDGLFNWTINEVLLAHPDQYQIIYQTNDLYTHLDESYNVNNIPTEYETKFHNLGKNINKVIFKFID